MKVTVTIPAYDKDGNATLCGLRVESVGGGNVLVSVLEANGACAACASVNPVDLAIAAKKAHLHDEGDDF